MRPQVVLFRLPSGHWKHSPPRFRFADPPGPAVSLPPFICAISSAFLCVSIPPFSRSLAVSRARENDSIDWVSIDALEMSAAASAAASSRLRRRRRSYRSQLAPRPKVDERPSGGGVGGCRAASGNVSRVGRLGEEDGGQGRRVKKRRSQQRDGSSG